MYELKENQPLNLSYVMLVGLAEITLRDQQAWKELKIPPQMPSFVVIWAQYNR